MDNNVLRQRLTEALNNKKNDINSFIWKGPRKKVNGTVVQEETKLVDATPKQLQQFYDYCNSMLYNKDKDHPGRVVLLGQIKNERNKCNVELFLRYVENSYKQSDRKKTPRFLFLEQLREAIDNTPNFPRDKMSDITISSFSSYDVPEEFAQLTIDDITKGCLNQLGIFNKKRISLQFLLNLGICLSKDEKKELLKDARYLGITLEEAIKERCELKDDIAVRIIPEGGLTFTEFRAMVNLRHREYPNIATNYRSNTIEYISMTTDQLKALREKVLFHLEDRILKHISQWESRMKQIMQVAESRGIELCQ